MRRHPLLLVGMTLLAAAGCSAPARPSAATAGRATAPDSVPFVLPTHCGIDEARFRDGYFEAVHPLSDGNGSPPTGWGDPGQSGTMRAVSPFLAEFHHPAGDVVLFRLRPGATAFRKLCS